MASDISIESIPGVIIQGTLTPDGRTLILDEKLGLPAGRVRVRVDSMESPGTQQKTPPAVEQIVEARYVEPAQMYLRFADGLEGTWTFEQLDLDMSNMKSGTIKVVGDDVEVRSNDGEDVQLDSSSLRYRVDAKYAAEIEAKLNILASRIGL
jgi:hypothetical protein